MAVQKIITEAGKIIDVKNAIAPSLLRENKLSEHLWIKEIATNDGSFILARPLIELFEAIREVYGKPIGINSGYRTLAKQKELQKTNANAVSISPHTLGLALDVDAGGKNENIELLKAIRTVQARKPLIRIGHFQYWAKGQYFIHIDVCPFYYNLKNGVWKDCEFYDEPNHILIPEVWREPGAEW